MLRIAVAQLNPTMGDIAGNLAKARTARAEAARMQADLILFTELFISGYPPEDMVLKPAFAAACEKAVRMLAADTADGGPGVIIGTPLHRDSGRIMLLPFWMAGDYRRAFQGRSAKLWRIR